MRERISLPVELVSDLLHAMNITTYSLEGYEADDLIGSLCHFAVKKDIPVRICSKDKDFEQLITENIVMYDIKKDLVHDTASLFEKKGITPAQVIDTLALIGDASDNVPGCPDVGPKTAQQWIEKYQTLDVLLENQADIKGKRGDSLRANIDQILLLSQIKPNSIMSKFSGNYEKYIIFTSFPKSYSFLQIGLIIKKLR